MYVFLLSHDSARLTHLLSTLSPVVLIDGLQAPNLSGKDDLHHQIGHQSYESKDEFGIPSFWELLVYLFQQYSLYF